MEKTRHEETRVQVSISYVLNIKKQDDKNLLDIVKDANTFKAVEMQRYGCACIPNGFIIFQGDTMPTKEDLERMILNVNEAKKKLKP